MNAFLLLHPGADSRPVTPAQAPLAVGDGFEPYG